MHSPSVRPTLSFFLRFTSTTHSPQESISFTDLCSTPREKKPFYGRSNNDNDNDNDKTTTTMTTTTTTTTLLEQQARKLTIVEYKKQAVAAKQVGNVTQALQLLRQAKLWEEEEEKEMQENQKEQDQDKATTTTTMTSSNIQTWTIMNVSMYWKKLAVLYKQAGNLEQAKQALIQAKQLETMTAGATTTTTTAEKEEKEKEEASDQQPDQQQQAEQQQQQGEVEPIQEEIHSQQEHPQNITTRTEKPETSSSTGNNATASTASTTTASTAATRNQKDQMVQEQESTENLVTGKDNEDVDNEDVDDEDVDDEEVDEEEAKLLQEFQKEIQPKELGESSLSPSATTTTTTSVSEGEGMDGVGSMTPLFSDTEMMNEEMMTEFRLCHMPVPSQEEYTSKILMYKQAAIQSKRQEEQKQQQGKGGRGDFTLATQYLRHAKQLEKVQIALRHMDEGLGLRIHDDPQGWLETLNAEESELLGQLIQDNSNSSSSNGGGDNNEIGLDSGSGGNNNNNGGGGGSGSHDCLGAQELQAMVDDDDVLEFLHIMGPSSISSVQQLQDEAIQLQTSALNYKAAGNLPMAKVCLLDSKCAKQQAERLHRIWKRYEGTDNDNNDGDDEKQPNAFSSQDLERLMMNDNDDKAKGKDVITHQQPPQQQQPQQQQQEEVDSWFFKPSNEIKQEVVRLKNEMQIQEATRILKIYKQVVQKEQDEIETRKCQEYIQNLSQQQLRTCHYQIRLWQYVTWFGGVGVGVGQEEEKEKVSAQEQYQQWQEFAHQCRKAIQSIQKYGSTSVTISPMIIPTITNKKDNDPKSSMSSSTTKKTTKKTTTTMSPPLLLLPGQDNDNDDHNDNDNNNNDNNNKNHNHLVDLVERGLSTISKTDDDTLSYLEIAILGIYGMQDNEKLQKIIWNNQNKKKLPSHHIQSEPSSSSKRPTRIPHNLRIDVKVNLPLEQQSTTPSPPPATVSSQKQPQQQQQASEQASSSVVYLHFYPTLSHETNKLQGSDSSLSSSSSSLSLSKSSSTTRLDYEFTSSSKYSRQRLVLPPTNSKQAKTLVRRMETKTVQFSVYYTTDDPPPSDDDARNNNKNKNNNRTSKLLSSWFFGNSSFNNNAESSHVEQTSSSSSTNVLLGKVTLELRPLLSRNCIVGDFPLHLLSSNHHDKLMGGMLRLCLGVVPGILDPERFVGFLPQQQEQDEQDEPQQEQQPPPDSIDPNNASSSPSSSSPLTTTNWYSKGLLFQFHNDNSHDDNNDNNNETSWTDTKK